MRGRIALVALLAQLLCACTGTLLDEPKRTRPTTGTPETPVLTNGRLNARVWRLSPDQFDNEVRDLLGDGIPEGRLPDSARDHFISSIAKNAQIDSGNMGQVDGVIRALAVYASQNGPAVSGCDASTGDYGTTGCIDSFIERFGEAAFRRPLEADETQALRTLFDLNSAEHGYDYGLGSVVRAVLLSPDFLYRPEIGEYGQRGRVQLTDYEIASLLAFSITDRRPDAELMNAAASGRLRDADGREEQARRLMDRSQPLWRRLFWEWLGIDEKLAGAVADSHLSTSLVTEMEDEYRDFVDDVVVEQRGTFDDLFGASYTFAGPELAAIYGVSHGGAGTERVELDPTQRAGLLTQGAWLASHATSRQDYVVRRAMGLYRDGFCRDIEPPAGLDINGANDALAPPDATVRERMMARGSDTVCGGCHRAADPIGLIFENFSNDGSWRDMYVTGNPVDSAITTSFGDFTSPSVFARALAADPEFQGCFVRRFTQLVLGADVGPVDELDWGQATFDAFQESGGSFEELLVALVRQDAFIEREKAE